MRDKILILNAKPIETNHELVAQLFHLGAHANQPNQDIQVSPTQNIIKDITWQNKYYETVLDVYIDVVNDEWLQEFRHVAFDELRACLGGVIVLSDEWTPEWARAMVDSIGDDIFLVWCLTNEIKADNEPVEELFHGIEIVPLRSNDRGEEPMGDAPADSNGESQGIKRVQEIIDNYSWENIRLKDKNLDSSLFNGDLNL